MVSPKDLFQRLKRRSDATNQYHESVPTHFLAQNPEARRLVLTQLVHHATFRPTSPGNFVARFRPAAPSVPMHIVATAGLMIIMMKPNEHRSEPAVTIRPLLLLLMGRGPVKVPDVDRKVQFDRVPRIDTMRYRFFAGNGLVVDPEADLIKLRAHHVARNAVI